jgi:branched-chain amino acid transport system substrate-binding protein
MFKKLISAFILFLLTISYAYGDKVKVGMITTLSGGGSGLGIDIRDGFALAVKDEPNIEIISGDDQRKPDIAVQLADKMIQSDKVDIITGIVWSNLAIAVVPAVVNQGKFYLSPNAGPSLLAGKKCHKNYFNIAWQNDNLHEAAGGYASSAGFKNSFIIAPNYPAGKDALTGYKRYFKGSIENEVYTKLGQTDYAAEIAKIRASNADSVYFFLPGGMGIAFIKQFSQAQVDLPLVGPAFSFDQGILKAVGDAALGVKNTSQWSKDIENAENKKFVEDFQSAYGRLPSLYASQGYDTGKIIVSAMANASIKDMDAFREALKNAPSQGFKSTRGKFAFSSNHHPIQDIYVREVVEQNGTLTNKLISSGLVDHSNFYVDQCKM